MSYSAAITREVTDDDDVDAFRWEHLPFQDWYQHHSDSEPSTNSCSTNDTDEDDHVDWNSVNDAIGLNRLALQTPTLQPQSSPALPNLQSIELALLPNGATNLRVSGSAADQWGDMLRDGLTLETLTALDPQHPLRVRLDNMFASQNLPSLFTMIDGFRAEYERKNEWAKLLASNVAIPYVSVSDEKTCQSDFMKMSPPFAGQDHCVICCTKLRSNSRVCVFQPCRHTYHLTCLQEQLWNTHRSTQLDANQDKLQLRCGQCRAVFDWNAVLASPFVSARRQHLETAAAPTRRSERLQSGRG